MLELAGHIIYNATFTLIYGYFALHLDNDPDDCLAQSDNDQIVAEAEQAKQASSASKAADV